MVGGNSITSENLITIKELINNWQIASISKQKQNLFEKYGSTWPDSRPNSTRNPIDPFKNDPFWLATRLTRKPDWLDLTCPFFHVYQHWVDWDWCVIFIKYFLIFLYLICYIFHYSLLFFIYHLHFLFLL